MAFSAKADSDSPRAAARLANRSFSSAEGRVVIDGTADRVVRQLIDIGNRWIRTNYGPRAPGGDSIGGTKFAPMRVLQAVQRGVRPYDRVQGPETVVNLLTGITRSEHLARLPIGKGQVSRLFKRKPGFRLWVAWIPETPTSRQADRETPELRGAFFRS